MRVKIEAVKTGAEIIEEFSKELTAQKVEHSIENIKLLVTNKAGADIDISADKLKVVFSN